MLAIDSARASPITLRRDPLPPNTRLGRYRLVRQVGRGGMAELYLARAVGIERFEKLVALKLVLPHLAEQEEFVEMFLREARLAASLDHPNIAQVLDLGSARDEYFIAMEYVHGETVGAMLCESEQGAGLPLQTALAVIDGAAAGLHYAHECCGIDGKPLGLVHRDVSPSNVLVRYDGSVKLVDFGIAKAARGTSVTRTGALKGKVGYMSPEQCRGASVDRRSDVYGLGILLYETTLGQRLFLGDNMFQVFNRVADGDFARPTDVRPDYPAALEEIILRALQTDPDRRYPSAHAMRVQLEEFAAGNKLRVSSVQVAETMGSLFGARPYPSVSAADRAETAPHIEPPATVVDTLPADTPPPRKRGYIVPIAAALIACGGLAALLLPTDGTAETASSPLVPAKVSPRANASPTPVDEPPVPEDVAVPAVTSPPRPAASSEPKGPQPTNDVERARPKRKRRANGRKRSGHAETAFDHKGGTFPGGRREPRK